MKNFHVAIIGGGIIGSTIAWEFSKYNLNIAVFEKGTDVAAETSKANSGVIHSGINSPNGSLKAKYCVEGNNLIKELSKVLGYSYMQIGKYIIAKNEDEVEELNKLKEIGIKNNVTGLKIVDGVDVKEKEANVICHKALWVPSAGIVLPYQMTIAFAENAAINDVSFFLETKVLDLIKKKENFKIKTNNGSFESEILVNAAGLHCREIVSMLQEPDFNVYPCRGEYLVLDKKYCNMIKSMIYPVPPKKLGVLGVHITPTIEGNILLGPSAEFISDMDDKITTRSMMDNLLFESKEIIPALPDGDVINAYSGIRCKLASPAEGGWADYRIEESNIIPGLINLLGIESPGLTAAPAIAKCVVNMISKQLNLSKKDDFKTKKFMSKRFSELSVEEKKMLIKEDESYGRIVCRCEQITEAEVVNALSNPLGSRTISSVKNRCRAGMGRCQGGFCTQHIVRIMEDKFGMDIKKIKLKSAESGLFSGRTREKKND